MILFTTQGNHHFGFIFGPPPSHFLDLPFCKGGKISHRGANFKRAGQTMYPKTYIETVNCMYTMQGHKGIMPLMISGFHLERVEKNGKEDRKQKICSVLDKSCTHFWLIHILLNFIIFHFILYLKHFFINKIIEFSLTIPSHLSFSNNLKS